ncbi:hypothetical protein F5X68DRAFT_178705 [Plectosphaerella plurivora]|uniref:DNA 3'-5' helicase n=2 Tax=Plectosphaerella plurivora TaxID=936078 RepID=A0A9P9A5L1_9PEZI|nr:hypothetical protein F5X68DRAFT_178705 [Plectosphaerella plurivora]
MDVAARTVDDITEVNEAYRVLLCKLCRYAVRPGGRIERHFRDKHTVKGNLLKEVVFRFGDAALEDPGTVRLPADGSAAVEGIPVLNGFRCTRCRYLSQSRNNVIYHWTVAGHGEPEDGQGRWTAVRLQTWCPGRYVRYWVVGDGEDDGDGGEAGGDVFEAALTQSTELIKAEDKARAKRGDALEGLERESSWVKRLAWTRHFGERDKLAVREAARWKGARVGKALVIKGEDEDRAALEAGLVGRSFERELSRCLLRIASVPVETLQRLADIKPEITNGIPFSRKAQEASIRKYSIVGQRYIGFCREAFRLGREEADAALAIRFNNEQWGLLSDLEGAVAALAEGRDDEEGGGRGSRRRRPPESESDTSGSSSEEDDDDTASDYDGVSIRTVREQAADQALFRFIVASVKQQVGGDVYVNPLLAFCAALGIQERPLGFTEPQLYTGLLAGILWWVRVFFLEAVFEGEPLESTEVGVDAVLRFKEEHARWMCVGTHTPVSTIIGWMAYGKGHRLRSGGQPTTRWSDDREVVFHQGEAIRVDDFKRGARAVVEATEATLDKLLGGTWEATRRWLDLRRVSDTMVRAGAGASFASNPKNDWLKAGPGRVARAVRKRLWDDRQGRWKQDGVRRWGRELRRFREGLMVAVHIWGGQPGRGPELTTLRHCDSWQLMRNVFVQDGEVLLVTDRDKAKATRESSRKVARFLPEAVGKMVVAYVAWVLPAERLLIHQTGGEKPKDEALEFMWRDPGGRVWSSDHATRLLSRQMGQATGVALGLARYRAVAIEMGRHIRGLVTRQAEASLGDGEGDEEDDHVEVDPLTGEAVDCSGSWNIVWDLQATHGTKIARQHYAVHISYPGRLPPEMVATYREISRLWHQFLRSGADDKGKRKRGQLSVDIRPAPASRTATAGTSRKPGRLSNSAPIRAELSNPGSLEAGLPADSTARDEAIEGSPPLPTLQTGLEVLLGAGAGWRSKKQGEAMRTIMGLRGDSSAIVVLPTGAGKSVLFMLPSVLRKGGSSIVVVPFVALMDDLVTRAREMDVECIRYRSSMSYGRDGLPRAARLVVASADVVSTAEFTAYADGLVQAGLLERIFVDECHTVITDVGYRQKLEEVKSLRRFAVPVVMLTATLPVALEGWFREAMLAGDAVVVRDRTTKLNCQYTVERVKPGPGAVEARVVALVGAMSARMSGDEKGVVYCRSKGQAEEVAEAIGCYAHHSGMEERVREDVRVRWAEGIAGSRWIAATSGLGTGIDVGGVVAVIHAERPWGLVDFIQQTGRGGRRAGEVVRSVVVHDGRPGWAKPFQGFVEETNERAVHAYVEATGCRRAVISAFADGVDSETCSQVNGAEVCDNCKGGGIRGARGPTPAEPLWTQYGKEEGERVRVLQSWLDETAERCPVCDVRDGLTGIRRENRKQRHKKDRRCWEVAKGEYQEAVRKVRFGPLACCFRCKLPLDWCQERKDEEGGGCRDIDMVFPVAMAALKSVRIRELAEGLGAEMETTEAYLKWLGRDRRFHGLRGTNLLAVWEAVVWAAEGETGER